MKLINLAGDGLNSKIYVEITLPYKLFKKLFAGKIIKLTCFMLTGRYFSAFYGCKT